MDFSKDLEDMVNETFKEAASRNYEFVSPEHLLRTALHYNIIIDLLMDCGANVIGINDDLEKYLSENIPIIIPSADGEPHEPIPTVGFEEILKETSMHCISSGKDDIDFPDVLVSMYDAENSYCSYVLKKNGIDRLSLLDAVTEDDFIQDSLGAAEMLGEDFFPFGNTSEKTSLETYTEDLTQKAREGKLDALVGREEELERTIQILCRRKKNNPLHTGDAGVGKTAITEGLAQRIVEGKVPPFLKDFSIYSLSMGGMIAGTKFRGEFEERLKKVTSELAQKEKAILFIDEIHTLIGAGSGGNSALDAANILKPLLTSGNIRCIGSTTFEEYTKIFEKDRALARRFQKVDIAEPSSDECLKILKGLCPKYSDFHKVSYTAESLKAAVEISVRFLPDRRLPDKAIDLIDEAGSYLKLHNSETKGRPTVTEETIRTVASKIARVPLESIKEDDREKLSKLEETLSVSVFGQEEAVKAVSMAVKKARAGFRNPEKPEGIFLFVGPTGVGKTELAKVLASTLNETLQRYDMSEYQEKHTVSRLIGSPPGYVGFEEGGILTSAVRKNPHSVILFDEIEKAHSDIYNIMLQIMDYGLLTDSQGKKADFKNCIIIMTSNAGARDMEKGSVGFASENKSGNKEDRATLKSAVEKEFSPEFRNRLDAIIPFDHLDKNITVDIVSKQIKKVSDRLKEKKVKIKASKKALNFIAEKGYSREFGARNIERTVEDLVVSPLVDTILFGTLSGGGTITVDVEDEKIKFDCKPSSKKKAEKNAK